MAFHRSWRHPLPLVIALAAISATPVAAEKPDAPARPVRTEGRIASASIAGTSAPSVTGSAAPALLAGPLRALKVATLELPEPVGALPPPPLAAEPQVMLPGDAAAQNDDGPLVFGPEPLPDSDAALATAGHDDPDAAFGALPSYVLTDTADGRTRAEPAPHHPSPYVEVALDILLDLPLILRNGGVFADVPDEAAQFSSLPEDAGQTSSPQGSQQAELPQVEVPQAHYPGATEALGALHHDPVAIFGSDPKLFPALAFEYQALAKDGLVPLPRLRPASEPLLAAVDPSTSEAIEEKDGIWPSPAERLQLTGPQLARARKCLAEAIYFESRGEPKRGQVAVAQVIVNRVFSGYYPADVCGTVYQNAHRHLACQFTFACDDVKDVIREPDMWVQAKDIAAEMLDGKLWLDSVGRATHYHAYWVHPSWVREMRKLDRIGVHTFYRPRRWGDG